MPNESIPGPLQPEHPNEGQNLYAGLRSSTGEEAELAPERTAAPEPTPMSEVAPQVAPQPSEAMSGRIQSSQGREEAEEVPEPTPMPQVAPQPDAAMPPQTADAEQTAPQPRQGWKERLRGLFGTPKRAVGTVAVAAVAAGAVAGAVATGAALAGSGEHPDPTGDNKDSSQFNPEASPADPLTSSYEASLWMAHDEAGINKLAAQMAGLKPNAETTIQHSNQPAQPGEQPQTTEQIQIKHDGQVLDINITGNTEQSGSGPESGVGEGGDSSKTQSIDVTRHGNDGGTREWKIYMDAEPTVSELITNAQGQQIEGNVYKTNPMPHEKQLSKGAVHDVVNKMYKAMAEANAGH